MGDCLPLAGHSTGEMRTPRPGLHGSTLASSRLSLLTTVSVHLLTVAAGTGRSTTVRGPVVCVLLMKTLPLYPTLGPTPLAWVAQSRYFFAVPVTVRADGYQPVGM